MALTNTNTVQPQTLPSSSIQKGADILISLIENERAKSAADARHELHELKNQFAQFRESSARQLQEAEQASREARTQAHLLWNERYLAIENERDKLKQTLQLAAAAFHRQMSLLQVEIDVLKKARSTQPENDGQRLSHNQSALYPFFFTSSFPDCVVR
jgi:hypothetical protein